MDEKSQSLVVQDQDRKRKRYEQIATSTSTSTSSISTNLANVANVVTINIKSLPLEIINLICSYLNEKDRHLFLNTCRIFCSYKSFILNFLKVHDLTIYNTISMPFSY